MVEYWKDLFLGEILTENESLSGIFYDSKHFENLKNFVVPGRKNQIFRDFDGDYFYAYIIAFGKKLGLQCRSVCRCRRCRQKFSGVAVTSSKLVSLAGFGKEILSAPKVPL